MKIIDKIKKELDKIKDNFNFDISLSQKEREENIKQGIRNTIYNIYGEENIADIKIDVNKAGIANVNITFIDNDKTRKWIDNANKKGLVK